VKYFKLYIVGCFIIFKRCSAKACYSWCQFSILKIYFYSKNNSINSLNRLDYLHLVFIKNIDSVAGLYAIYGQDDVILNIEGRMQMRYNIYILLNQRFNIGDLICPRAVVLATGRNLLFKDISI